MATINVTTFVDDNDEMGTEGVLLQEGIIQANSDGAADTTNLPAEDAGNTNVFDSTFNDLGSDTAIDSGDNLTLYQIYLLSRLLQSHHYTSRKNVYWATPKHFSTGASASI